MTVHDSILDTIGHTPVVRLHRIAPRNVTLFAKAESFNPGGSVKDRLAIAIVLDAEAQGLLKPGDTIIEATRQYRCGAGDGGRGARLQVRGGDDRNVFNRTPQAHARLWRESDPDACRRARQRHGPACRELAKQHGWFLARQFVNPANPAYHRQTTAAEILRDFAGRRLDHFVTGWGTGGTLTGVGEVLAVARPEVKVTTCEPAGASLLAGKEWTPHKIQGWTPDFVPEVLNRGVASQILPIDDVLARDTARRLAQEEGIFVGISSGATVAAALQVAQSARDGDVILAMLPDTGERYLSTFLFEGVNEGSDDEWLASL
jgi:cysteine synthase A